MPCGPCRNKCKISIGVLMVPIAGRMVGKKHLFTVFHSLLIESHPRVAKPPILLSWASLRGNLEIQRDTRDMCTQRKDHLRTQREGGCLQRRNQTC
ncbi:unnamed protein product [Nyctereutes procyonoides]|uniref:(raccoon dog) hypothetical protein n=1 Tax=Nyctereutes procyonoides TaxID=34880 RepID=A0A811ZP98_NYCPR|nr:unnamed protein product [Nyctereutes procyonoides]